VIEAACGAEISVAPSSKLSVISAHLRTGTDRAVSFGACGSDGDVEPRSPMRPATSNSSRGEPTCRARRSKLPSTARKRASCIILSTAMIQTSNEHPRRRPIVILIGHAAF